MSVQLLIQAAYFVVAVVFILGLKAMSSPVTARKGVVWAGYAMIGATVVTFAWPGMQNFGLMIAAIVIGSAAAWISGKKVAMTDMPQMVAIYNGMGGGAAAAIAALEFARGEVHGPVVTTLAVLGALIGSVAFSGSCIAFAKLQGIMKKAWRLPAQNAVNVVLALVALGLGISIVVSGHPSSGAIIGFFVLSLVLGVILTSPIGGADMPVVISLLNSYSGLAAAAAGFVILNKVLIVSGSLVGASGIILTSIMCKAMNRSLGHVLFSGFGAASPAASGAGHGGVASAVTADEAYYVFEAARSVVFVPGYGMAVAQAQHTVKELGQLLEANGCEVQFAVHPVAGRMPGHMNVLLAEADVPYEQLVEMDDINPAMPAVDLAVVIGANDVVNPAARDDASSPIYGMPIINVDYARTVYVLKRSMAAGFAGLENPLFFKPNVRMLFGDAKASIQAIVAQFKG